MLGWKGWFYGAAAPWSARLGPAGQDRVLRALGRIAAALPGIGPGPRLREGARRAVEALDLDADPRRVARALAANLAKFQARDYPLGARGDDEFANLFDVEGFGPVAEILDSGRGVVLAGAHFGAHLSGLHWLYRRGLSPRLLVQRPRHVSDFLNRKFDEDGPYPQRELFLKREISGPEAVNRVMLARSALRAGMPLYVNGDIPWVGPNTRRGRLLGETFSFLSMWTDLATLTRAPVATMFCGFLPGGRHRLVFGPPREFRPGSEPELMEDYLRALERAIAESPGDAVAHLTWPCYRGSGGAADRPRDPARPGRMSRRNPPPDWRDAKPN